MRISDWSSDVCSSDLDDLSLDSEILQHRFQQARILLQRGGVDLDGPGLRRRSQQVEHRELISVAEIERGLALSLRTAAGGGRSGGALPDLLRRSGGGRSGTGSRRLDGGGRGAVVVVLAVR